MYFLLIHILPYTCAQIDFTLFSNCSSQDLKTLPWLQYIHIYWPNLKLGIIRLKPASGCNKNIIKYDK